MGYCHCRCCLGHFWQYGGRLFVEVYPVMLCIDVFPVLRSRASISAKQPMRMPRH